MNAPSEWLSGFQLTEHARTRMKARHIPYEAVAAVIEFGRVAQTRGATIFAIGRKEIDRYGKLHSALHRYDGLQIVCEGSVIVTVYRNHDLSGLRKSKRQWKSRKRLAPQKQSHLLETTHA